MRRRFCQPVAVVLRPRDCGVCAKILGLTAKAWTAIRDVLVAEESIVTYRQAQEGEETLCDRENMERLLRMVRLARRPRFQALPVDKLPLFLAVHQGVAEKGVRLQTCSKSWSPYWAMLPMPGFGRKQFCRRAWNRTAAPGRTACCRQAT